MDREDLLAMLVIASEKKNSVVDKTVDQILPLKCIAAMALAQHLHRAGRHTEAPTGVADIKAATAEFQERIRRLNAEARDLEEDNRAKAEKLDVLSREIEQLDKSSSAYKQELDRVKGGILALEEQSSIATQHLNEAFTQLNAAQRLAFELERTVTFMRNVCQMLAQEHDPKEFSRTTVSWLSQQFGVERCSLMTLDPGGDTLQIAAQCGIDPEVASRIKVRLGQGIAGWVARNRKPLFVRVQEEVPDVTRTLKETYNSDSFICLPLIFNNRLYGVMSLSNKREGEPFEAIDLDRATMAGAVLAILLAGQDTARDAEAAPSNDAARAVEAMR
jgi:transcriptional regulator with GAF, ATPase, and Fis domain